MGKKLKSKCCDAFKEGKKACKGCPTMAPLAKKERKKLIARYKK